MSVVGNIILNLAFIVIGILITPYVDSFRKRISKSYKKQSELKKKVFDNTVQFIINNPHEETNLRIRALQRALGLILILMFSMLLMLSNNIILSLIGFLCTFSAFYGYYQAMKLIKILEKANDYKVKKNPNIDLDLYIPKKKKN